MIRQASPSCLRLIKAEEGLKDGDPSTVNLDPYLDDAGVWTIAWGHAIRYGTRLLRGTADEALAKSLYPNGITMAQAEALLAADALEACRDVSSVVTRALTQGQFDALVDWTFNLGVGRLVKSTLLRKVNAYDDVGAAAEFERWVYAGTPPRKMGGLIRRRKAERALYEQAA